MATKKSITNETVTKTTRSKKVTPIATAPIAEAAQEVKEIVQAAAATIVAKKNVKVNFTFAANNNETEKVAVLGDFNNWNLVEAVELKKQKDGSFKGAVDLEKGKSYQYRFFVNGTTWANDPTATNLVQSPFGTLNAVIEA